MNTSFAVSMEAERLVASLLVFIAGLSIFYFLYGLYRNCTAKVREKSDYLPELFAMFWPGIALCADFVSWLQDKGLFWSKGSFKSQEYKRLIHRSGFKIQVNELYGAQLFFALAGFVCGLLLASAVTVCSGGELGGSAQFLYFLGVFGGPVLFFLLPPDLLKDTAKLRQKQLLDQLPLAIDILASSMTAGLTFQAAVKYLVDTSENNELLKEFRQMHLDFENGSTLESALRLMARRLEIPEFSRFTDALLFGIHNGTEVVNILMVQTDELRRIKYANAEMQAERAPNKMIGPVMLIFVAVIGMIMVRFYIFMLSFKNLEFFQ